MNVQHQCHQPLKHRINIREIIVDRHCLGIYTMFEAFVLKKIYKNLIKIIKKK